MDVTPESELLQRSGRGDADAFAVIVTRYWPLIYSITFSTTRCSHLAEDLAQETFCRAYVHMNGLNDPERLRSWLWGIARNVCTDWLRKTARHGDLVALPADAPSNEKAADKTAEDAERFQRVRVAVAELPEKYQVVVHLRHLQGMSYKEIAGALGMSISGVSSRLTEAHELLRVKLKPLL